MQDVCRIPVPLKSSCVTRLPIIKVKQGHANAFEADRQCWCLAKGSGCPVTRSVIYGSTHPGPRHAILTCAGLADSLSVLLLTGYEAIKITGRKYLFPLGVMDVIRVEVRRLME